MNCNKWRECCNKMSAKMDFLPALVTRLVLGPVFLFAGWMKLNNMEKVVESFAGAGIPAASIQAPFVAGVEFLGGILLLLGLATRCTSALLFIIMVVATLTAHRADIVSVQALFTMTTFLYGMFFIWLMVKGAGCVSVDHVWAKKCQAKT